MKKVSLETDLESNRPKEEIILGLGMVRTVVFFIFTFIILKFLFRREFGLTNFFIAVVLVGTFLTFLKKYDSDEVEARGLYLVNSLYFRLFEKGVKRLNAVKDIRESYFVIQNGGVRTVIEIFSNIELSCETEERAEQLIAKYCSLLETFNEYFQLVVRIREVEPEHLVYRVFGTEETPESLKYREEFEKHKVASVRIYLVLASDPEAWFYFEKYDERKLLARLEAQVHNCIDFLNSSQLVSRYRRLEGDNLIEFVFDENFFQREDDGEAY